ncbi:MAG: NAD-dependent epimerase/dehydratase family protein [Oscillospiraceae bacterium]|nr:NAD-dependent epimerase/dehydratase family protein [Oscillospiraceae bacterium]
MKRILVTGAGSYIGTSFVDYLSRFPGQYEAVVLDMIGDGWKTADFSGFDAVYHVAGIAHIRETEENAGLYYAVNRDLAVETARKAKKSGVPQFVFLSSMSVYGMEEGCITRQTEPNPRTNYGKSKLQAEAGLKELADDHFRIAVLRPPMVYGEGCKGNYQSLVKFAKIMPFFPDYPNKRSMIHVDVLSDTVKTIVDSGAEGLFLPQDPEYVCTCHMVRDIAAGTGKKLKLLKILNPAVSLAKRFTAMGRKAFGDLYYLKEQA